MMGAPAIPLRIAVIEDDGRYRRSLEMLFSGAPGFALAASYSSAEGAIADVEHALAHGRRPLWDLVVLDLDLPGVKGIDAARALKAHWNELPVVVLTVFEEPGTILRAICAGADGYLLKKASAPELLAHIRGIAAGGASLTPAVARTVLQLMRTVAPAARRADGPARLDLTDREQDVLRCLVRGLSYKQAADALDISLDTVRTHVRSIYAKLQVHSVAEAVGRAIREGLV